MVSKDIRDHMLEIADTFCYQHSSSVKSDSDVLLAAQKLLDECVFTHRPGRTCYNNSTDPATLAIDMYHLGLVAIADGKVISDYQERMQCNTSDDNNGQEGTESLSDEDSSIERLDMDFISK